MDMSANVADPSASALTTLESADVDLVRLSWCDLHGALRTKTLTAQAARRAVLSGIGMVSTLMLKDTSDRTAYQVFEPGGTRGLEGFECAGNFMLKPTPESFRLLPWAQRTGWMRGELVHPGGTGVAYDTRAVLRKALSALADRGLGMACGLEVEFHVYRIKNREAQLDPQRAAWPGEPPEVEMVHPGYNLLSESWADMAEEPLRIVHDVALRLGLPLLSLEIELGPSQVEAVFDVTDALQAADNMVLFRSAVRQALLRAGYWTTFMCRPPFPNVMSSGWHLHQSLVSLETGHNMFMRDEQGEAGPGAATSVLSNLGAHYLAGLLTHAAGMAPFCTPTTNGYGRFRPNALAPQAAVWGRDNRGAMLRVIGAPGDKATRIENRIGEPLANPYLYLASQIYSGLDGVARSLEPPQATDDPYQRGEAELPTTLEAALAALLSDDVLCADFGVNFIDYFTRVKTPESERFKAATDTDAFFAREYFSRY